MHLIASHRIPLHDQHLAEPVAARDGLRLERRVGARLEEEDVRGGDEVEADRRGARVEQQRGAAGCVGEPRRGRGAAPDLDARGGERGGRGVERGRELREDERLRAGDGVAHLAREPRELGHLGAAPGDIGAAAERLGVALLEE